MSKKILSDYLRLNVIKQIRESISEPANNAFYMFAAKHTPYSGGDESVPDLTNTVEQAFYYPYVDMVFGKRLANTDLAAMAPRHEWTANTKYDAYRSDEDLSTKNFVVCVNNGVQYDIFKCLDNGIGNVASTVAPDPNETSPDDVYYKTSDGYVWKYLYSVDSTTFNKFATATRMPVFANNDVVANAVSGAIDFVDVTYRGSNYNAVLANTFISSDIKVGGSAVNYNIANNASASNNFYTQSYIYLTGGTGAGQGRKIIDYVAVGSTKTITIDDPFDTVPDVTTSYQITPYCLIVGDGSGAIGRAIVNTSSGSGNTIWNIEVVERGSGYTWATATLTGNTGAVANSGILKVIIGPKGGHGSDPEDECMVDSLCFSTTFTTSETNTIPVVNDYRQIGLLKDPLFANVVITVGSPVGGFVVGEIVTQANTGAVGIVNDWDGLNTLSLTDFSGQLATGNTTNKYIVGSTSAANAAVLSYEINGKSKTFNTFDQRWRYTFTPVSGTFTADETIFQTAIGFANAIYHSNTATDLYITGVKGAINSGEVVYGSTSGASATPTYQYPPDLVPNSGEILYLENRDPITRSSSQSETVKLILQF